MMFIQFTLAGKMLTPIDCDIMSIKCNIYQKSVKSLYNETH